MSGLSAKGSHRYRAYISYSHHDEKWAVWLHKKLESYRIPRRLVGLETTVGVIPRRIAPIFRDREELPSATDLGETVNRALADSLNLIVICSPHAVASRWVNEEILTFKRLGREDRIFCLIVDGEPESDFECFPPSLRFQVDVDGNLTDEPYEPIAADAREGKDGKTAAKLKLIAGIIGVGFDELRRRELHRRHFRMAAVTAVSLSVMVLTSALALRAIVAERAALDHREQAEGLIMFMLGDLRDKLDPIGRLDVLDSVGDKALEYFDSLDEDEMTTEALTVRVRAMRQLGEVRKAQGQLDQAIVAFERAFADASRLVERNPDSYEAQYELGQVNFWIGYTHMDRGDLDRCLDYFEDYLEVSKRLVRSDPGNERWLRELAFAHTDVGAVHIKRGEPSKALEHFRSDQSIGKDLVERNPHDFDLWFHLSETTSWVGTALAALGRLDRALEQFQEEVAIKDRLVRSASLDRTWKPNTHWLRRLSLGHRRVGEILEARGQLDDAMSSYEKGLAISESLVMRDSSNANWKQDVGRLRSALGRTALAQDDAETALGNSIEAIRIFETLLSDYAGKPRWRTDYADSHRLAGTALLMQGESDEAGRSATKAIEALSVVLSTQPDDRNATRCLSAAQLLNGRVKNEAGDNDGALKAWHTALELIEPLAVGTEDYRILSIQAEALLRLDRTDKARPATEKLRAMGYANPSFVAICERAGLTARVVK